MDAVTQKCLEMVPIAHQSISAGRLRHIDAVPRTTHGMPDDGRLVVHEFACRSWDRRASSFRSIASRCGQLVSKRAAYEAAFRPLLRLECMGTGSEHDCRYCHFHLMHIVGRINSASGTRAWADGYEGSGYQYIHTGAIFIFSRNSQVPFLFSFFPLLIPPSTRLLIFSSSN